LEHRYSATQIDIIADEHKALVHVYRSELVLKHGIDALSSKSNFKDGWSLLAARFPNLMDYHYNNKGLFCDPNIIANTKERSFRKPAIANHNSSQTLKLL
jgi:hypothetical protein